MINRCILKDTKVFESFFNAFECIGVFQYNSMLLQYISMYLKVFEYI
jgi:hypothetical protein